MNFRKFIEEQEVKVTVHDQFFGMRSGSFTTNIDMGPKFAQKIVCEDLSNMGFHFCELSWDKIKLFDLCNVYTIYKVYGMTDVNELKRHLMTAGWMFTYDSDELLMHKRGAKIKLITSDNDCLIVL